MCIRDSLKTLRESAPDGKLTDEQKGRSTDLEQKIAAARNDIDRKAAEWADGKPLVKQVIDLALLANGLLRGESLSEFVARSVKML